MNRPQNRRRWTPAKKLQVVLETLQPDRKLAETGVGHVLLHPSREVGGGQRA